MSNQQPTFGLPPSSRGGRGRGRGRGRGGYRGGGNDFKGYGMAQQATLDGLDTFFPEVADNDTMQGSYINNLESKYDNVRQIDEIDSKLGFARYQEGPTRLGWLINMHATSVVDVERNSTKAAVDYYFLEQDGGSFKCTLLYQPYFYVVCVPGTEGEVEEWLVRQYDKFVERVSVVEREDLGMANHLTGRLCKLVQIVFRNVQDLLAVRRELQPIIKRNSNRSALVDAYMDDSEQTVREVEDSLLEMREFDVPYYLRVAIDKSIRVGLWYDVTADAGEITLTRREDLVQRADPVVLAFDIETTKLPLKFPDATIDMIMMISYMVDGQGYLITNREVVSEDIEDFEYTPTKEFPGPFMIFNEPDEAAVIRRFFDHIREAKPTVLATYNGDMFDWPFVETRAIHHGFDMRAEIGWYRDESDEYKCRSCVHMDCFRWVKRDSYLPVGSHGLKAVTTAKLGYNPMEIDPEDMTRFAAEQPQTLAQYSVSDAVATYYLYMKYVNPFIFSLCNIIPLNPDEVLRKGSGTLCETLLMVEAYVAKVAIPNKHADPPERVYDGHLVETETYVGGHVEALEAGVFRSDIPMQFRIDSSGVQRLIDELDRALKFSIEVEGKHKMEEIDNYDEVRSAIAAKLEDLRDTPHRSETPLIYHLDVAAMYPNIILTNRLQPDAIVNDAVCASCDFNVPGKTCDRRMPWLWRGEYFPAKRGEVNMLKAKLQGEMFPPAPRSKPDAPMRTFDQLSKSDQAAELKKRVSDYSRKVYHRLRDTKVEEREAVICQRENPFYVDTVRNFRDRRYVYKGLLKKEKRKLDDAIANSDHPLIDAGKKLVVLYDSLQLAHKCILNSFYGYVMRKGARWHSLEMAGVVCLTGSRIIQMARQRVEQLGRPLELDTDGIWCALPGTFPENYSFKLKGGKGKFGVSYPCTMLNHLVYDKFTNHQYQDLVDAEEHTYKTHSENSIFFEVDGPYRAMILPSSKEADKLLKKRYAVFNDDGSLAELKGFEVKRRGELKLIKIFQSQIFKVFLEGTTLAQCYAAVARVADQWLDILFSKAQGLPDHELFDLITENRSMSKSLEEYGAQKSTSICTARRLAEFLGDQMVKDKGLACKFVISKKPLSMPVSERAVPVAIFSADAATRRQFLRRWLRDNSLEDADIRSILDWDYYLERFGSVIQKLITIPAAMQGVTNPVPRIPHPDWLTKRVAAAMSTRKQRHLTDMFKSVTKEEHLANVSAELERSRIDDDADMEDFGVPGSGANGDLVRRKMGVVHSKAKRKRNGEPAPLTIPEVLEKLNCLGTAPDPSESYTDWLEHSKAVWKFKRKLHALRLKAAENGDVDMVEEPAANGAGLGQFFTKTHVSLARNVWHVVQWAETETPGELRAWVWVGGQLHTVRVEIPRILYVTSAMHQAEIASSKYFSEAKSVVLPRTAYVQQTMHTYKCVMTEKEYIANSSHWGSFFAHPGIGGVYETEVTPLDRALIELGATAWLNTAAKRRGAGRSMADTVGLADLDTRRTTLALPPGVVSQMWGARDLNYAILYHASAPDGRQFFAFVNPAGASAHVCVVNAAQKTVQLQLPNMERLYRESLAAARGAEGIDDGAFVYPDSIEFTAQAFATLPAAYRAINSALAKCVDEKKAPTMLVCQSPLSPRELQAKMKAIGEFPTVRMPTHHADRSLPALDWQRHAGRRLVASLLSASHWVAERIALAQYADIPVGNLPADAPLFLADVFFARKLTLAKHVLWWSPGSKPDIGGRQDDEFSAFSTELAESGAIEVSVPGSYAAACAEIELRNLAVNTILKAPLVNEIEGTVGVFGYDAMSSNDAGQATLIDDDVADRAALLDISSNKTTASQKPADGMGAAGSVWAAASTDGTIPASTFQLLRSLLRGWCMEIDNSGSPFAGLMAEHFFRWLIRPSARLHDPALAQLVRALMRKVFLQLRSECQKLGAKLVYGTTDKLILSTGKGSVLAAQATIDFIIKAVQEKPLFESISLVPLQYWTYLVWMDATNFGGIVVQQDATAAAATDDPSDYPLLATSSEPRIEMMWSIKDYLPPLVQGQFEVAVAEYIYKLAGFYEQQRSRNSHATHTSAEQSMGNEAIDDNDSDTETAAPAKTGNAAKAAFYKRLIGQYFTRKLLAEVPEIRSACLPAHRDDPSTQFPHLPGSRTTHVREAALEFVKYVTTVFALELPAANFVRVLRRNLLAVLSVGEFSDEAKFVNPCARLVLPQVVCDYCTYCRDLDFCRDADLLPSLVDNGQWAQAEWQCLGCGNLYDRVRIEERLVAQMQDLVLAYQTQDLVCQKCRLMKQDNFSMQCASCAGKYKTTVDARSVREQIAVYHDVAELNRLPMLLNAVQWAELQK